MAPNRVNDINQDALAADNQGIADHRPALVLLHGLTFDRTMWRPALDCLARVDPERRVLAPDLPGHGASPPRSSYDLEHVVEAVHESVEAAQLNSPVVVGHSIGAIVATVYAARHPVRGIVNVDQPLQTAPFAQLVRSLADRLRGPDFPAVWKIFASGFHTELLPPIAQELVRETSHPRPELVLGYWRDLLERTPAQIEDITLNALADVRAKAVPYQVIAGDDPEPGYADWLTTVLPNATLTVWSRSGHFPHLAHPDRFADRLAATGAWPDNPLHDER